MKGQWRAWVALAVAFLLASTWGFVWPGGLEPPDLVAAVVTAATLTWGSGLGAGVGVVGGLAIDFSLGRFIGLEAAMMALIAWLTGVLKRIFDVEGTFTSVLIVLSVIVFERIILFIFYRAIGFAVGPFLQGVLGVAVESLPFYLLARLLFEHNLNRGQVHI